MSEFSPTIRKQYLLSNLEKDTLFKNPAAYAELINRITLDINDSLGGAFVNAVSDINNPNCVYALRLSDFYFEDKYDDNNNFIGTLIYREIELKSWQEMFFKNEE